jgi:very-short-patch-repair endonuclease
MLENYEQSPYQELKSISGKLDSRKNSLELALNVSGQLIDLLLIFFSAEVGLIIEVDGSSHNAKSAYDRYRQDRLESFGFTLIRFQEGEVIHLYPDVENEIRRIIEVLKSRG